jgi:hypothetical protein
MRGKRRDNIGETTDAFVAPQLTTGAWQSVEACRSFINPMHF